MNNFKNLVFILPIIFYYFIESLITGGIIFLIWIIAFQPRIAFSLSYFDWVFIVWVIKILLFDIFKVSSTFTQSQENKK